MSMACTVTYQRPWHGAEHTYMPWTPPPMLLHAMYTSLHAMEICVHGMESFPLLMTLCGEASRKQVLSNNVDVLDV